MFVLLYKCDGWIYFIPLLSRSPLYCIRYVEGRALIFFCENSKITTHCWTIIDWRMLDPTKKKKKKKAHVQGQRRSPNMIVGGEKLCLESNPIPARDAQRAQTQSVHTRRTHREWARPAFECWSVSCGGPAQQWPAAGALGAADLGMA